MAGADGLAGVIALPPPGNANDYWRKRKISRRSYALAQNVIDGQ
jgi:hypothetical protein